MASPHDHDQSGQHPFVPSMSQPWGQAAAGLMSPGADEQLRQLWSMVPPGAAPDALGGLQVNPGGLNMLDSQVGRANNLLSLLVRSFLGNILHPTEQARHFLLSKPGN